MKKTILVVDDDKLNLMIAQKLLSADYRVAVVNSGKLVFKYLEKTLPDLILLDILMPGMDGLETLRRIKARPECKDIPVIMLTGLGDEEMLNKCLAEGAVGVIHKPFLPDKMFAMIEQTLQ